MKTQDQVWAIFVESNPIPEHGEARVGANGGAAYLVALREKADEPATSAPIPIPRRRLAWAAAALLLVAVAAVVLLNLGQTDVPPATSIPEPIPSTAPVTTELQPTTTTLDQTSTTVGITRDPEGEAAAIEVVQDAFDAFNNGDGPTWAEIRYRGSVDGQVARDRQVGLLNRTTAALVAANGQYTDISCESAGFSVWSVHDGGPLPGFFVECTTTLVTDFHDAAGVQLTETFEYLVDEGDIVAVTSDSLNQNFWEFGAEFGVWLPEAHPELTGLIFVVEDDGSPVLPGAEMMETALQFVGEFVAQSDRWFSG